MCAKTMSANTIAGSYLDQLVVEATSQRGVPSDVASRAAGATKRNLLAHLDTIDPGARDRMRKYFWTVISNASLRSGDPRLRAHRIELIAATVTRELREAGYSDSEIEKELRANYPHLVSAHRATGTLIA